MTDENKKEWEKVEADIFKFENEGDNIEGVLTSAEESKTYNNKVYKIKKEDGKTAVVFGTTVLDSQMNQVSIGDEVKILLAGTKPDPKGRNDIKMFEVFVRKAKE